MTNHSRCWQADSSMDLTRSYNPNFLKTHTDNKETEVSHKMFCSWYYLYCVKPCIQYKCTCPLARTARRRGDHCCLNTISRVSKPTKNGAPSVGVSKVSQPCSGTLLFIRRKVSVVTGYHVFQHMRRHSFLSRNESLASIFVVEAFKRVHVGCCLLDNSKSLTPTCNTAYPCWTRLTRPHWRAWLPGKWGSSLGLLSSLCATKPSQTFPSYGQKQQRR